ncbi:IQ domain-containing protein N isoform X2 [Macrotis lagotis]
MTSQFAKNIKEPRQPKSQGLNCTQDSYSSNPLLNQRVRAVEVQLENNNICQQLPTCYLQPYMIKFNCRNPTFNNVLVDEMDMILTKAATIIQSVWRGYHIRQKMFIESEACKETKAIQNEFSINQHLLSTQDPGHMAQEQIQAFRRNSPLQNGITSEIVTETSNDQKEHWRSLAGFQQQRLKISTTEVQLPRRTVDSWTQVSSQEQLNISSTEKCSQPYLETKAYWTQSLEKVGAKSEISKPHRPFNDREINVPAPTYSTDKVTKTSSQINPTPGEAKVLFQAQPTARLSKNHLQEHIGGVTKDPSQANLVARVAKTPSQAQFSTKVTKNLFHANLTAKGPKALPHAHSRVGMTMISSKEHLAAKGTKIPPTIELTKVSSKQHPAIGTTNILPQGHTTAGVTKISSKEHPAARTTKTSSQSHLAAGVNKTLCQIQPTPEMIKSSSQSHMAAVNKNPQQTQPTARTTKTSSPSNMTVVANKTLQQVQPIARTTKVSSQSHTATVANKALQQEQPTVGLTKASSQSHSAAIVNKTSQQAQPTARTTKATSPSQIAAMAKTLQQGQPTAGTTKTLSPSRMADMANKALQPTAGKTKDSSKEHLAREEVKTPSEDYPIVKANKPLSQLHLVAAGTNTPGQTPCPAGAAKIPCKEYLSPRENIYPFQSCLTAEVPKTSQVYSTSEGSISSLETHSTAVVTSQEYLEVKAAQVPSCEYLDTKATQSPSQSDLNFKMIPSDLETQDPSQVQLGTTVTETPLQAKIDSLISKFLYWRDMDMTKAQTLQDQGEMVAATEMTSEENSMGESQVAKTKPSQEQLGTVLSKVLCQGEVRAALITALSQEVLGSGMAKTLPQDMLGPVLIKVLARASLGTRVSRALTRVELGEEVDKVTSQGKLGEALDKALTKDERATLNQALSQRELRTVLTQVLTQGLLASSFDVGATSEQSLKEMGGRVTQATSQEDVEEEKSAIFSVSPSPTKVPSREDIWLKISRGEMSLPVETSDDVSLNHSEGSVVNRVAPSLGASREVPSLFQDPRDSETDSSSYQAFVAHEIKALHQRPEASGLGQSISQRPMENRVIPHLNQALAATGGAQNLSKLSIISGVPSSSYQKSMTNISPNMYQMSGANGVAPSIIQESLVSGMVPRLHQTSMTHGVTPPLPQGSLAGGRVPDPYSASVISGISPGLHQTSMMREVASNLYQASVTNTLDQSTSQTPVRIGILSSQQNLTPESLTKNPSWSSTTNEVHSKLTNGAVLSLSQAPIPRISAPDIHHMTQDTSSMLPYTLRPNALSLSVAGGPRNSANADLSEQLGNRMDTENPQQKSRSLNLGVVPSLHQASMTSGVIQRPPKTQASMSSEVASHLYETSMASEVPPCLRQVSGSSRMEHNLYPKSGQGSISSGSISSIQRVFNDKSELNRQHMFTTRSVTQSLHQNSGVSARTPSLYQGSLANGMALDLHQGSSVIHTTNEVPSLCQDPLASRVSPDLDQGSVDPRSNSSIPWDSMVTEVPPNIYQRSMTTERTPSNCMRPLINLHKESMARGVTLSQPVGSPIYSEEQSGDTQEVRSGQEDPCSHQSSMATKTEPHAAWKFMNYRMGTNLSEEVITNSHRIPEVREGTVCQRSGTSVLAPRVHWQSEVDEVSNVDWGSGINELTPNVKRIARVIEMAPNMHRGSKFNEIALNVPWGSAVSEEATNKPHGSEGIPSVPQVTVVSEVAPSVTQGLVVNEVIPNVSQEYITGGADPAVYHRSIIKSGLPQVYWRLEGRQSVPRLIQDPRINQGSVTNGVTPNMKQGILIDEVIRNENERLVSKPETLATNQLVPSLKSMPGREDSKVFQGSEAKGRVTHVNQGVTSTISQSMGNGVVSNVHRTSICSRSAQNRNRTSVASGVLPHVHQGPVANVGAPSIHQGSKVSRLDSGVHQESKTAIPRESKANTATQNVSRNSVIIGVTPRAYQESMGSRMDPRSNLRSVSSKVAPNAFQGSMPSGAIQTLKWGSMTNGSNVSLQCINSKLTPNTSQQSVSSHITSNGQQRAMANAMALNWRSEDSIIAPCVYQEAKVSKVVPNAQQGSLSTGMAPATRSWRAVTRGVAPGIYPGSAGSGVAPIMHHGPTTSRIVPSVTQGHLTNRGIPSIHQGSMASGVTPSVNCGSVANGVTQAALNQKCVTNGVTPSIFQVFSENGVYQESPASTKTLIHGRPLISNVTPHTTSQYMPSTGMPNKQQVYRASEVMPIVNQGFQTSTVLPNRLWGLITQKVNPSAMKQGPESKAKTRVGQEKEVPIPPEADHNWQPEIAEVVQQWAASVIQAAFRGHRTRTSRKVQHKAATLIQAWWRGIQDRKTLTFHMIAATKIQASWRSFHTRKKFKNQFTVDHWAELKSPQEQIPPHYCFQSCQPGFCSLCQTLQSKAQNVPACLAVITQLSSRTCHICGNIFQIRIIFGLGQGNEGIPGQNRSLSVSKKFHRPFSLPKAAMLIQALWKGYKVRKDLSKQQRSAIWIQALWRGCHTRKNLTEKIMLQGSTLAPV